MSDILISIIEAAANARARRGEAAARTPVAWQPPAPGPPIAPPPPVVVKRAAKPKPHPELAHAARAERRIEPKELFASPQSLIRTVLAGEILGPPIALRRQNPWEA